MSTSDTNINELKQNFIKNSSDFYNDGSSIDVDNKHHTIINKAYKDLINLNSVNFRNWTCQSDQGAPSQFMCGPNFNAKFVRPLIRRFLYSEREKLLTQCFHDDIAIIESIGGGLLLKENPVLSVPGVSEYAYINGYCVNTRWLRYIYIAHRILSGNFLENDTVWLDVGSYYGGIQGLIRKYKPNIKCILVDFHHQLLRSYIYLHTLYPNANHILPDKITSISNLNDIPDGSFTYMPASLFNHFRNQKIGLATNFFSFGEMKKSIMKSYLSSDLFNNADFAYIVNRFISSPFFEPIYDTDSNIFDYISFSRNKIYFDMFPIHHYLILERQLFGRRGYRNISSPYFEMITRS